MSDDIQGLLGHGHKIADIMGAEALEGQKKALRIQTKIDKTVVTNIDKDCEKAGRNYLGEFRPRDKVWGEEFGKTFSRPSANDITWIFDPIDGTKGLIAGLPIWTNLIAAFRGEELLFGIINNPTTGERFWGGPALPSRYSCIDQATGKRVETSILCADVTTLDQLVWASTTRNYMEPLDRKAFDALEGVAKPHEGGDAMLYAGLALRKFSLVYDGDMSPWDIAAPAGVVLGAKGIVTDAYGKRIDYFREGKTTVLAGATESLHKAGLALFETARRSVIEIEIPFRTLKS